MATPFPVDLSRLPPALLQSVVTNAERDAERVAYLLDELAQVWRGTEAGEWLAKRPVHLPAEFLLGLGAALRLLVWESKNIHVHREVGLPAGREAVIDAFQSVTDPEAAARNRQLPLSIYSLTCANFAWAGLIELTADVTLDPADEEIALEALAEFLWSNRHLGIPDRRN